MKYILSLFIVCVFALAGDAQIFRSGFMEDTVAASETIYLYPGDAATASFGTNFNEFGALQTVIVLDSLSGATAATVTLQYCFDAACNYTYDVSTTTMNGPTQQVIHNEDAEFIAKKFRVKVVVTAGVQSDRIRCWYNWKRKT